ncbi:MAG TPA: type II secretion system F family protein [Chthonomonadaceae bacterium]|nr:type II secretion system F family protein [Chthonomonadaceae bacterium]
MTNPQTNDSTPPAHLRTLVQHDLPQPLALLLFTQRLAALMEAHIGPVRAFAILEDAPAPYGAVAEQLKREIEQGNALCQAMSPQEREEHKDTWWHPISLFKAMSQHPEHFSPVYVTLVRAGEMAGTVDETLRRVQVAVAREWRLLADHPAEDGRMFLSRPASLPQPQDWRDLSAYQQMVTLALFFETFSVLLTSGWALLPAMETVSALLPEKQAAEFLQVRQEIKEGAPLLPLPIERLDFIPRYAKEIAGLGMMKGCAETALHDVALLFEQELEYRLQGIP